MPEKDNFAFFSPFMPDLPNLGVKFANMSKLLKVFSGGIVGRNPLGWKIVLSFSTH